MKTTTNDDVFAERHPEKYAQECLALEAYLTELWEPGWGVEVWAWAGSGGGGFHISEINVTSGHTGFGLGYSRCDGNPGGYALILACENFVLTFHEKPERPEGWESDLDLHDDARAVIASFLKKSDHDDDD